MKRTLVCAVLLFGCVGEALAGILRLAPRIVDVPTLDDLGLTVLTLVVAIAGGIAVRRRKKK